MTRTWVVIVCVLALAAVDSAAQAKDKLLRIGISQIVEHPALDATRQGFIDALTQNGGEFGKKVEFDYKNAQNNRAVSGQIARTFVGNDVNLILAISTPSAQDAAAATKRIPILFSAVTDPKAAGLVKSLDRPGCNVSGTCDRSPVARQLELIRAIVPAAKTIGTIYNPGEVNSLASVADMEAHAAKMGLTVVKAAAASSNMVKMAAESLLGRVDAIQVPTDNTVVLALEQVVKVCQDNKVPLFAADVDSVTRGAIAALGLDYYKLGRQTGAMARRILQGNVNIQEMPVESQKDLDLHVNPAQATKMGVTLPEAVLKQATKIVE